MKLFELAPIDNFYIVFYKVRGSRNTGSYLVNAPSLATATKIVRAYNPEDYTGLKAMPMRAAIEQEYSMDVEDFLANVEMPAPGGATHLESGT